MTQIFIGVAVLLVLASGPLGWAMLIPIVVVCALVSNIRGQSTNKSRNVAAKVTVHHTELERLDDIVEATYRVINQ